ATSIRDALKSLFSEPRLPDNPYYYLAATLNAQVDQSQLWKTPPPEILSAFDVEGGLEPIYGDLQLCKLYNFGWCYGLPHVLRVITKEGAAILHEVLINGLPECLYNALPLPTVIDDAYSVQALCSVQGSSALWRPQLIEFPELEIRCDVVVRGDKLDEALRLFVDLVMTDVEELNAVPVYFVDGIRIMDGPASVTETDKELFDKWYPLDGVLDQAQQFEKTAARLVLGGKVLQLHAVLLVDAPSDPKDLTIRKLRYEIARKTYFFHYHGDLEARPSAASPMSHYGCNPYDALFSGYFLDLSTARQYSTMYATTDKEPYHKANLTKQ
ncbi:hypothetical protein TSOC_004688, partial [Tetrabaena socialis]